MDTKKCGGNVLVPCITLIGIARHRLHKFTLDGEAEWPWDAEFRKIKGWSQLI